MFENIYYYSYFTDIHSFPRAFTRFVQTTTQDSTEIVGEKACLSPCSSFCVSFMFYLEI